jgi:3-oxoacyl-[acyl-carrier protein] reductase
MAGTDGGRAERLFASPADVSKAADVRRWVAAARERLGAPALLVNNAGVYAHGEILSYSEEEWDRSLDINLKSAFLCTREVLPLMREHGGGWIINIASLSGKQGMAGGSAYCASKCGMVGFSESLGREEAKHGIRATAICPGYVATPMAEGAPVPPAEMVQPSDIAATVLYLLDLSPHAVIREIVVERTGVL